MKNIFPQYRNETLGAIPDALTVHGLGVPTISERLGQDESIQQ
jgi:hypothetical protein